MNSRDRSSDAPHGTARRARPVWVTFQPVGVRSDPYIHTPVDVVVFNRRDVAGQRLHGAEEDAVSVGADVGYRHAGNHRDAAGGILGDDLVAPLRPEAGLLRRAW